MDAINRVMYAVPPGGDVRAALARARREDPDFILAEAQKRAKSSGVPERYVRTLVEGPYRRTEALRRTEEWADGTDCSLLLAGAPGCGKTFAACWALLEGGYWSATFRTARSLMRLSAYSEEEMRAVEAPELLVIDDIGAEWSDGKGFMAAMIDGLLAERHARNHRTVMTSNLTVRQFGQRYGARVADRLRGEGLAYEFNGPSLRGRSA